MSDYILMAADEATMTDGLQLLGTWRSGATKLDGSKSTADATLGAKQAFPTKTLASTDSKGNVTPDKPILQGMTPDNQQWFIVPWGTINVPVRNLPGWVSNLTKDAVGKGAVTWTPNGPAVAGTDAQGNQISASHQPYDTNYYAVLRWLGDNPPSLPPGIVLVDQATLDPDALAGLVQIA